MRVASFQIGIPAAAIDRSRCCKVARVRHTEGSSLSPRPFVLLAAIVAAMALLPFPRVIAADPALCADATHQTAGTLFNAYKLRGAESALAQAYAAPDAKLDPPGKRNLKLAQAAWLRCRDLTCNLETGDDPAHLGLEGTIMPMLLGERATALTEQRTRDLAGQAKCPGGDLSCEQ